MEIRILGWEYENIRRFSSLQIDLLQGNAHLPHNTLVMMRNGTGKTTTISLMRSILSGAKLNPETVLGYKPLNSDVKQGTFYIKIKFGTEIYHYKLNLDYVEGKASYETSRVGMSGGMEPGHNLPMQLIGVLNSTGFINRFIFDGEQAKKTLTAGSKEAELAVTYLYQIDKLDELVNEINSMVSRKQTESESKGATETSLKNIRTRMENKKKNHFDLLERHKRLLSLIMKDKAKWEDLEERRRQLIESDEELRKEQVRLLNEQKTKNNDLIRILQVMGIYLKEPYLVHPQFNDRLINLVQNMQTLKLPKTTAKEFFKELSESPDCICGRPIGLVEKEAILRRADNYLGEDDLSAINAIKDKIRNYQVNDELKDAINQMVSLKESIQGIQSALDRLVLNLNEEAGREANEISDEQTVIKQRISDLERDRNILEAPIGATNASEQNNLALAEKAGKEAEENYTRASGTYEYTQKSNKLISYIKETRTLALQKLKTSIIEKTNEKVAKIITDERITVEKIEGSLILQNRSGASEGQTLGIAYSYIGSLFEHSSFEFPFVIDSPAASMDLDVRREVASIIPTLFKQLIIFVTSGEVAGFAEKFYDMDDVLYITIAGSETGEATQTIGKDYFSTYQSEEDE